MVLFVVPAAGQVVDDALRGKVNDALRRQLSPRHVPDRILAVPEIPRTLNGKKLEVPVKRLLIGAPLAESVSEGAIANPAGLKALLRAFRS